jgi:hypothetical protein
MSILVLGAWLAGAPSLDGSPEPRGGSGPDSSVLHPAAARAAGIPDIPWPPELSGAALLPDRTIALVDDETRNAIFLWDGHFAHPPERLSIAGSLDDLEGAAADSAGNLYLLTSHSLTRRGRLRPDRQRLARLQAPLRGADIEIVDDLRPVLLALLGSSAGPLNLEGLAWYPVGGRLLLGARSPLASGRAQVVALGPVEELFDPERAPGNVEGLDRDVHRLDLGGRGIRSLDYDPWRRAVLVLAGPAAATEPRSDGEEELSGYALFIWHPEGGQVERLESTGLAQLAQPEAAVALGRPDANGDGPLLLVGEGAAPLRAAARPAEP